MNYEKYTLFFSFNVSFPISIFARRRYAPTEIDSVQEFPSYIEPQPQNVVVIETSSYSIDDNVTTFLDSVLEDYTVSTIDIATINSIANQTLHGIEFEIELHNESYNLS